MLRLLLATTLLAPIGLSAQGGTKPGAGDFKVAVVDLNVIQQKSKWASSLMMDAKQQSQKDLTQLNALREQLQKKTSDSKLWMQGTEQHDKASLELGMLRTRISNLQKMYQTWHDRRLANALLAVRAEIDKKIAEIAKKNGYLLVLRKTVIPKSAPVSQKLMALQSKIVLFADASIDISDRVVQVIDAERVGNASSGTGTVKKSEATDKRRP